MSLIEREKLIDHLNACLAESDGETPITDAVLVAIKCAVEQMPEVDAVPVVHGEWVEIPYKHFDPPDFPFSEEVDEETGWTFEWDTKTVCLNCRNDTTNRTTYCSNCGAKMDGGGRKCD